MRSSRRSLAAGARCIVWLLALTMLLTIAAMLIVVAVRQKDSHDKRFLLSR